MISTRGLALAGTALSSVSLAQSWYVGEEDDNEAEAVQGNELIVFHSGYDFGPGFDRRRHIPQSSYPSHPTRHSA